MTETSTRGDAARPNVSPTPREATAVWARVALLSFGGPAGQLAVMHRILVEEKRWIGDARFLHALNFCMLLPGPEAQQLATYIGWLLNGPRGGLIAGGLFVLPGTLALMALSWLYVLYGELGIVSAAFLGLKAVVLAIVLQALARLGGRILRDWVFRVIAAVAFAALFAFGAPFPLVILVAALTGFVGARLGLRAFDAPVSHGTPDGAIEDPEHPPPDRRATLGAGLLALALWVAPVALLLLLAGRGDIFTEIALFFSKRAVVTFGGAYAVLVYVAQEAVGTHGWLVAGEMVDGLGMAETTPGPLVMVLQFVGFLAAYREADWASALLAGTAGGLLTTWVTFAPCFAWIFLCAPFVETLRSNAALSAALKAVTAAVVGVILNLAVWFAIHTLFGVARPLEIGPLRLEVPDVSTVDWSAAALVALALVAVFRLRLGMGTVLAAGAALGILARHVLGL